MTQYKGPGPVHGAGFAPLNSWHEEDETHYYNQPYHTGGDGYYDGNNGQPPSTVRVVDSDVPDGVVAALEAIDGVLMVRSLPAA